MGVAENKEVIRKMREAKGLDAILATMSDDVRWTLIGNTKYSGTMNGKQEIIGNHRKALQAPVCPTGDSGHQCHR